jgi:hypothetical protein
MSVLIFDADIREGIRHLCEFAFSQPVNMPEVVERLKTPEGRKEHRAQMTRQTMEIPVGYLVTFSVETGHPCGTCRHMSMSVHREGRVPHPAALWEVAKEFGFWGALQKCAIWEEELAGHGIAINVVQPVAPPSKGEGGTGGPAA